MEALKAISLPPGFGFHPTDVELISHYLRRKNQGLKVDFEVIPELDIYKHEPWDLPACCQIPTRDSKWHFLTSRAAKYPNGSRSNRATETGYWKSTGKDRSITSRNRVIGAKKTLVFHEGRPPYGKRTDWIMHEYSMDEKKIKTSSRMKNTYVLCRVTKRNGFAVEGEDVSAQTEEVDDCQNTGNNLYASLLGSVVQEESIQSGGTENLDAWFEELFDPNFDESFYFNVASVPVIESTNVPQASQPGLGTLIPKNDPWHMLHDDFIAMPKINESLGVDHNRTPSSIHLSKFATKDFKKEMPDLSNSTKFTGIQIPAIGTFQNSVKLHVQTSMMKSSNSVSVSQTIKFAHVDHHISTNSKPLQPVNLKVQKKGETIQDGVKGLLAVIGSFLCLGDDKGCCFLSACIFGSVALVIYFLLGHCLKFLGIIPALGL